MLTERVLIFQIWNPKEGENRAKRLERNWRKGKNVTNCTNYDLKRADNLYAICQRARSAGS